jgi:hypothetical protein
VTPQAVGHGFECKLPVTNCISQGSSFAVLWAAVGIRHTTTKDLLDVRCCIRSEGLHYLTEYDCSPSERTRNSVLAASSRAVFPGTCTECPVQLLLQVHDPSGADAWAPGVVATRCVLVIRNSGNRNRTYKRLTLYAIQHANSLASTATNGSGPTTLVCRPVLQIFNARRRSSPVRNA